MVTFSEEHNIITSKHKWEQELIDLFFETNEKKRKDEI